MTIINKITMDLANRGIERTVDLVQGDRYGRLLQITLLANNVPWPIPNGAVAVVRYQRSDGKGGVYGSLPDGSAAYSISGNVLTVIVTPQVCAVPGRAGMTIALMLGEMEINTFVIHLEVAGNPGIGMGAEEAEEDPDLLERVAVLEACSSKVLSQIAKSLQVSPLFANSIAECTDISKLYVLPDGYIYAYMAHVGLAYENQIPRSINSDGSAYNGGRGYKTGYRLNSSGVETAQADCGVTGFIPVKYGDVVRFKNFAFTPGATGSGAYIAIYDSAFTKLAVVNPSGFEDNGYLFRPYTVDEETGYLVSITLANEYDSSYGYAYIRISAPDLDGNTIVTVNEEIPGEEAITYAWGNTGHAFVPADYEDRIISVENDTKLNSAQIASLKFRVAELEGSGSNDSSGIPDYVVTEAESVIDRVIAAQGNRTFTFAALTDMHYGSGSYTAGVINACNAMKYIDERIKLDAVAVLGDYTDGYPDSGYDNAIADFKAVNGVLDGLRFAPNLRLAGNHDIYGENPALTMRYINAYSDDVVWGSSAGGYYYRDFDSYKIRAIGLNTSMLTIEQYNWFVSALDLSGKDDAADWSILVLSHHPLDWYASEEDPVYRFCYILDGYKNGTSGTAGEVSYDFTGGKNAAKLIGNIHGHIHNFKVDYIHFGNVNGNNKSTVLRVATPNACYNRENEYEGTWADETAYNKTKDSAKDTSFCIYCIDLDACTIKAICYGAGYDREIEYGYTNDIEPPAKKTTSSEVWTFELEDGSTVSKQVVVMV